MAGRTDPAMRGEGESERGRKESGGEAQMAELYRNQRLGERKGNVVPQSGRLQEAGLTEKDWAEPQVLSDPCTRFLRLLFKN